MTQFIDPKTLSRIKDLPLVAKTLAHGFLQGAHNSIQRGVGIEFSQYRVYEPGDDLSKVDWKLFARSDRYFVREAERESDINVWLILDTSASMLQYSQDNQKNKPKESTGLNKFQYGRILAATLSYLSNKQGDSVGLFGASTQKPVFLPAFGGDKHHQKILINLAQMTPGGHFPSIDTLRSQLHQMQKSGIVIVISDFYQHDANTHHESDVNDLMKLACQCVTPRTEVIAVQLESADEIHFPFKGALRLQDLETEEELLVSAKDIKGSYLKARNSFVEQLKQKFSQQRVQHWQVNIDQPLDETLHKIMKARQRVSG